MNASDQPERASRVEREIREILDRADPEPTAAENVRATLQRQAASARSQMSPPALPRWIASRLSSDIAKIGAALILAVAAAGVSSYSALLAAVLGIAAAGVFFSLWFPSRVSRPGGAPRWRGQDLSDQGPSPPIGGSRNRPR